MESWAFTAIMYLSSTFKQGTVGSMDSITGQANPEQIYYFFWTKHLPLKQKKYVNWKKQKEKPHPGTVHYVCLGVRP